MSPLRLIAVCLVTVSVVAGCKTTSNDPLELGRAWNAAIAEVPQVDGSKGWQRFQRIDLLPSDEVAGVWPTVIYMHGCNGIGSGSLHKALVRAGFAVISPNSLARENYHGSCIPRKKIYGTRRDAIAIRTADLAHAIEQAKMLPWVDARNIFLVGQSEGGAVVATFRSGDPRHSVAARVIGGHDCSWGGVQAPRSEPVLAILGSKDHTFQLGGGPKGSCGSRFRYTDNGSRNVVYTTGSASVIHGLIGTHQPSIKLVVEFLLEHRVDS